MVFTRLVQSLLPCLAIVCTLHTSVVAQSASKDEESAIKSVLARFYDGWNAHDAEKMISVFADDIDHVNVFAEWHRGKADLLEEIRHFHAGPGKNSHKTWTIEKIRLIRPDVAVVHVRSLSTVGNLGTYVMTKDTGQWLVVSFTNVGYELDPKGEKTGITKRP